MNVKDEFAVLEDASRRMALVAWVISDCNFDSVDEFAIMVVLAALADSENFAEISMGTLCWKTRVSRKGVVRALERMIEAGLIVDRDDGRHGFVLLQGPKP
jgi:hypothetical protein